MADPYETTGLLRRQNRLSKPTTVPQPVQPATTAQPVAAPQPAQPIPTPSTQPAPNMTATATTPAPVPTPSAQPAPSAPAPVPTPSAQSAPSMPSAPAPAPAPTPTPGGGLLSSGDPTVAGQLQQLTARNNPLLAQARNAGLELAASRGLLNSSIAAGAAQDSFYRAALPIAQQDANTFAQNQLARFNAQAAQDLAGIETANRLLLQTSESAQNTFTSMNAQIAMIMMNKDMDEPSKTNAIRDLINYYNGYFAIQSALLTAAGIDNTQFSIPLPGSAPTKGGGPYIPGPRQPRDPGSVPA